MAELSMGDLTDEAATAADLAADTGQITWLTEPATGERVAAIVPAAAVAECPGGRPVYADRRFHTDGNRCRCHMDRAP